MSAVEANAQAHGFQAGHVIADKYELEALVGEGGMGSVWRARHKQLESAVALKLMSPAIASQPEALDRFLREARAAARLSSQHVVKVFDFGVDVETPFIAMELLVGENLRARLDRLGVLSPEATLWVIRQAGRALSKAHGEGIVHRDLKPENLFITQQEDEVLKVLDFGIAKLSGSFSGVPDSRTRTGAVLGTPYYMSPEQTRGIKAVDHRSDIWALGVIAFECLTGQLPFDSEAFGDLVLKICALPAPVPSSVASVPAGFDAWFARATERDTERRYASVQELVAGLQVALAAAAPPSSPLLPVASVQSEREPRLTVTRTDVTAVQSVMDVKPAQRVWLFAGLAALLGALALVLLLGRAGAPAAGSAGPNPSNEAARSSTASAASRQAGVEASHAVRSAALEARANADPAQAAAAGEPFAPTTAVPSVVAGAAKERPARDPVSQSEPESPPAIGRNSVRTSTSNRGRKLAVPLRAARRSASSGVKPSPQAARGDLFSEPD